jgi:hypothetical protein
VFKWIFCRYICETGIEPITDSQLFLSSGFRAYMDDERLMKEYTIDNADNIYNVFISSIMKCLVDRGLLKDIKQRSGNTELNAYESTF